MTERKPISPPRTLVKPGEIKARLAPGRTVPKLGRTLVGPGEIGRRDAAAAETGLDAGDPPAGPAPDRLAANRFGLSAESVAAALLVGKGYRILARRWRSPYGEVDIVARDRATLIFVEVKARGRLDDAAHAVTPRQRHRIAEAAAAWLAKRPDHAGLAVRFDVVLVAPRALPRHVANAFDIDG